MAGGLGTRMRSSVPKHFHPLLGRRMVDWIIETGRAAGADPIVVVASPATRDEFAASPVTVAIQETPLGTGDAVRCARAALAGHDGDVLVLSGDTPLLTAGLLEELVETHRREGAAATILSAEPPDPRLYGRIVRGPDGSVLRIVEGTDANEEEQQIREINSSIYVFRSDALWPALERIEPHNAQGELYLTDAIEIIVADGGKVAAHVAPDSREADGVNTRAELAQAAAVLRDRINEEHMLAGVTIVDPKTTWIDPTVELEPDVTIQPFAILRGATRVATGAEIGAQHRRDRRPHRNERDDRPVLLPSPWDGPRRLLQGRHLRGDQELTHRRPHEGAAPVVHRRRRDRRGHECRRRSDHRQLPAQARPAQGPHDDRQQRQDRHPQWLRRAGRGG